MAGMSTIGVRVRDHTGDLEGPARLQRDRTIGQSRPTILESLGSLEDRDNVNENSESATEEETFSIYNESDQLRYLQDGEIVGDVLCDGQTLRVVPEIMAGGSPS